MGEFVALHLPLKIGYGIAIFISDVRYIFARQDRKAVKENLKAIFPEKSDREICRMRLRVFRNFAKYLVDFFRFRKLDLEYIKRNIKIENSCYLDEALAKGKGAVILSGHIGNWELGGVVIALSGYPFWVVALEHKHKRVNDFFNFQRESKGVKVIPLRKAVRQCFNLLKENEFVALVGDRDFTERGKVLDFLGKPTLLPEGPAAFALKTGAVIAPGFMVRNKDDSFTLRFEKLIEVSPDTSNRNFKNKDDEKLMELMVESKAVIERYIRQYPDQWYMFRRYWVE